ncbi:hypothetical protein LCGC14_0860760 [marine sediment metagenome]|uniref:Uncharacterized protein n=1 Tax=marine sediment metagenome TaxID=412755 RepID=A0A0F9SEL1_9ZZZZ
MTWIDLPTSGGAVLVEQGHPVRISDGGQRSDDQELLTDAIEITGLALEWVPCSEWSAAAGEPDLTRPICESAPVEAQS